LNLNFDAFWQEYLPIGGLKALAQHSEELAYGKDAKPLKDGTVAAVQALSGTGSVNLIQIRWRVCLRTVGGVGTYGMKERYRTQAHLYKYRHSGTHVMQEHTDAHAQHESCDSMK
jgi:hypothetical protein